MNKGELSVEGNRYLQRSSLRAQEAAPRFRDTAGLADQDTTRTIPGTIKIPFGVS